jgi:hypothetical protein
MVSCFMLPFCRLAAAVDRGNVMSPDEVPPVPDAPMARPSFRVPCRPALLAAAALLLAGCGLADYEAHMSSEAVLVQRWDEEAKQLGEPINTPELPKVDGKDVIWNLFLCLPRGCVTSPVTQPNSTLAQLRGGLLAQYAQGNNSFGIQNVYVGLSGDDKDYPAKVLGVFAVPTGGEAPAPVTPATLRSPLLKAYGKNVGPEVPLKRKVVKGPPAYSFNFFEREKSQVAVVFQTADEGALQKAGPVINMSLATLAGPDPAVQGGGPEADNCRSAYAKTHHPPQKR